MKTARLLVTFMFAGMVLCEAEPAQPSEERTIGEFRSLVAISPGKRTKEQKERVRDLWRSSEKVRDFFHGASVLQAGDSVFDFPGLIQGKTIDYDAGKREYVLRDRYTRPSGESGNDHWVVTVTFTEDGIVTDNQQLKMNSR